MSRIGVDTGGTFTDLAFLKADSTIAVAKRPSTPGDFSQGVIDVVDAVDGRQILPEIESFYHGCTVATNAMITRSGVKVGFLTTAGHRDSLPMMRVSGRTAGLLESELKAYSYTDKPAPIVPPQLIREIHERVDARGSVIVPLDEEGVRQAIRDLVAEGVKAIGVCLLWSFMNRTHEERVQELIREEAPDLHVSISSDIVPAIKEYERSATTAVNAYLAPLLTSYLRKLEGRVQQQGLGSPLYLMQSVGGVMRAADSERKAVNTLVSGPAAGVIAARFLGGLLDHPNIICADVGGTSFDVGLVVDGDPVIASSSIIDQYTLLAPTIDVVSIGAGGGSVAWVDLGRLRVGPQSAGADPGPVCYGQGGTEPTVTDADVVLGYIDPNYFLGGEMTLDRDLAEQAIRTKVAEPLGMSVRDAAAGIVEIANQHMSDLVRKMTIERGYDPRDFVLYAYGGAGPLHGAAFGGELGVKEVVFPLGNIASAFSALGLAVSDLTTVAQASYIAVAPFNPSEITSHFEELEQEAITSLGASDASRRGEVELQRTLELRYKGQVHQVDTPVPSGPVDESSLGRIIEEFERRYELLYGRGSGFKEGGIELINYRVLGVVRGRQIALERHELGSPEPEPAQIGEENLYWRALGAEVPTKVYGGELSPGMEIQGPAVVRLELTTCLIGPGQQGWLGEYGNIRVGGADQAPGSRG